MKYYLRFFKNEKRYIYLQNTNLDIPKSWVVSKKRAIQFNLNTMRYFLKRSKIIYVKANKSHYSIITTE